MLQTNQLKKGILWEIIFSLFHLIQLNNVISVLLLVNRLNFNTKQISHLSHLAKEKEWNLCSKTYCISPPCPLSQLIVNSNHMIWVTQYLQAVLCKVTAHYPPLDQVWLCLRLWSRLRDPKPKWRHRSRRKWPTTKNMMTICTPTTTSKTRCSLNHGNRKNGKNVN